MAVNDGKLATPVEPAGAQADDLVPVGRSPSGAWALVKSFLRYMLVSSGGTPAVRPASALSAEAGVVTLDPETDLIVLVDPADLVGGGSSAFADLTGDPGDNANLAAALDLLAPNVSPTLTGDVGVPTRPGNDDGAYAASTGFVQTKWASHIAAVDPHTQYVLETMAALTYQPLDADLTAFAAVGTAMAAVTLTGTTNDYAPTAGRYYRVATSGGDATLTGFVVASAPTGEVALFNAGPDDLVLKHQDAGSTAANRFVCVGSADITVAPNGVATLVYDATDSRWRAVG